MLLLIFAKFVKKFEVYKFFTSSHQCFVGKNVNKSFILKKNTRKVV